MDSINTFGDQTSRKLLELVSGNVGFEGAPPAPSSNSMRDQFHVQNVVENQAAEAIPAFGLMRVTGISVDGDRYILEVDKPNSDTTAAYLVNGPREIAANGGDDRGAYQNGGSVFVLRTDETESAGPLDDWTAEAGTMFRVLGQVQTTAPKLALVERQRQSIRLCKPTGDIAADGTGTVTIWDDSVSPPVETTETVSGVVLDWMDGGTKVSSGKECALVEFGSVKRLMFAECE